MELHYRSASINDLESLVMMLADDTLGATREVPSVPVNAAYVDAFSAIDKDPNNHLTVVELDGKLLGMFQLTYIPYLSHAGGWRCLVENVRVHESFRGRGYGELMLRYGIDTARQKGCRMVQLTSDKNRVDAIRFYERLGFKATHEGFKYFLSD